MSRRTKRQNHTRTTGALPESDLGSAAALVGTAFKGLAAKEAIPATWEDRAIKAWEYYQEEPLVANAIMPGAVSPWAMRSRSAATPRTYRRRRWSCTGGSALNGFVRDMVTQLLVKGDAIGYFGRTKEGDDIEEVLCVNPVSVKIRYEDDELTEAIQHPISPEGGALEPVPMALAQMIHLRWNAPPSSVRGNSMAPSGLRSDRAVAGLPPGRACHRQTLDHTVALHPGGRSLWRAHHHAGPEDAGEDPQRLDQMDMEAGPGRPLLRQGGDVWGGRDLAEYRDEGARGQGDILVALVWPEASSPVTVPTSPLPACRCRKWWCSSRRLRRPHGGLA